MDAPQRSPGDRIVIALFAVLLLLPAAFALSGHAGFDTAFIERTEDRFPFVAPPPSTGALATGGWQRDAERQIADGFPLRRQLIQSYDDAKYYGLGDIASTKVMRGRDEWLFLAADERGYITGRERPSDAELIVLADRYRARAGWCARHGIAYVVVLAPNKSTIYARFLPDGIQFQTPTPADRLFALLWARRVNAVDVRRPLVDASSRGEVYSKGDTHWNDAGAYVAFRAIVAALRSAGVRDTIAPAALHPNSEAGPGDLLRLAGIADRVENRIVRYAFPRRAREVNLPAYADPAASALGGRATAADDASLPTAVVFGDSFVEQLQPFLSEVFRRAVFFHRANEFAEQFSIPVAAAERPAVIIDELVERNLVFGARLNP